MKKIEIIIKIGVISTLFIIIPLLVSAQEYTLPISKLKRYNDWPEPYYHNDSLVDGIYSYTHEKDSSIIVYKCYVYKGIFYNINDTSFLHKKKSVIYWPNGNKHYEFFVNEKKWVHGPFIYYRMDGTIAARGSYWKDSLWTFLKDTAKIVSLIEDDNPFTLMTPELSSNKMGRWLYLGIPSMKGTSESWFYSTETKRSEYVGDTTIWYYDNEKVRLKIVKNKNNNKETYEYLFYNRNGELIRRDESETQNRILFEGF